MCPVSVRRDTDVQGGATRSYEHVVEPHTQDRRGCARPDVDADEEAGYPSLAELPPEVIATARRLREASNAVTASVYLQHVVPSATLDEVRRFME